MLNNTGERQHPFPTPLFMYIGSEGKNCDKRQYY